jgi:hypothetical protein
MATWNSAGARVAARKSVPNYPLAMDGVIWVKGAISSLPSATTNRQAWLFPYRTAALWSQRCSLRLRAHHPDGIRTGKPEHVTGVHSQA